MKKFFSYYFRHYAEDPFHLAFNIFFGIGIAIGLWAMSHHFPWPFILGYIACDPLTYFMRNYRKEVLATEIATQCKASTPSCNHEPLLTRQDGSTIEGTKCCKHCGLNEAYWQL